MDNNMLERAKDALLNKKRRSIWHRIVSALGCVVVFCTTYALILPAITMTRETICGLEEHAHTQECYETRIVEGEVVLSCDLESLGIHAHEQDCYDENHVAICGYANYVVHVHDDNCYADGELVCQLQKIEEHIHDAACYESQQKLACGQEEGGETHTHVDGCYTEEKTLVCTEEEGGEIHVHGDGCHTEEKTLICTEEEGGEVHIHDESCYTQQKDLICGQEEAEGVHSHTDECYTVTSNLTCGKEEKTEIHTHSDDCYNITAKLTCTKEEKTEVHTHGDACYSVTSKLTCGKEEVTEVHTHSDSCYEAADVLTCRKTEVKLHTHEGDCFETREDGTEVLVCTEMQVTEHAHTDSCFIPKTETVTVCGLEVHSHVDACYPTEPEETEEETTEATEEETTEATEEETTEATEEETTEAAEDESSETTEGETTATETTAADVPAFFGGNITTVASGTHGDNLTWIITEEDGVRTLTISGEGEMKSYSWKSQYPWYSYASSIQHVVIEEGVTTIGYEAFYTCAMTSVVMADSVTTMSSGAFERCTSLVSIKLSNNITEIPSSTFERCSSLTSIVIPDSVRSVGLWAFMWCSNLKDVDFPEGYSTWSSGVFTRCEQLPYQYQIPEGTFYLDSQGVFYTVIDDTAYIACNPLNATTYPDAIPDENSNPNAYPVETAAANDMGTSGSTKWVVLDKNGETWLIIDGDGPMQDYGDLYDTPWSHYYYDIEQLKICDGVTHLGDYAFREFSIKSVEIPDSVKSIGECCFAGSSIQSFEVPANVTSMGSAALAGIANITLETGNTSFLMEDGILYSADGKTLIQCTNAKRGAVVVTDRVEKVEAAAFANCVNITSVSIPNHVTIATDLGSEDSYLGVGLFSGCTSLTSVTLPEGMTQIPAYTFYRCSALKSVTIPETVTSIGSYAFYDTDLSEIVIPDSVSSLGSSVFSGCKKLRSVTFPKELKSIGSRTFSGCVSLTCMEIPEGVTQLGTYAFSNCTNLESISFPKTLTSVGQYAFQGCTKLRILNTKGGYIKFDQSPLNDSRMLYPLCYHYNTTLYADDQGVFYKVENNEAYVVYRPHGVKSVLSAIPDQQGNADVYPVVQEYYGTVVAEGVTGDVQWKVIGKGSLYSLHFSGEGKMADYSDRNELPWIAYANDIHSIVIEEGVTHIGANAFDSCIYDVCGVILPDSIESIGDGAFQNRLYNGYEFATIVAPEGYITLGKNVFAGCQEIGLLQIAMEGDYYVDEQGIFYRVENGTAVVFYQPIGTTAAERIPDKEGDADTIEVLADGSIAGGTTGDLRWDVFMRNNQATLRIQGAGEMGSYESSADVPWRNFRDYIYQLEIEQGATSIGAYAFGWLRNVSSVVIPDGVTTIGAYAFSDMQKVETIHIPESVTTIGEYAFYDMYKITSIELPSGLTEIVPGLLERCFALKSVNIPEGVTAIGERAFLRCRVLDGVEFPNVLRTIGDYAFGETGLTKIALPDGLESIGYSAFEDCKTPEIVVPDSVTTIGARAFSSDFLIRLVLPRGLTEIPEGMFYDCRSLTDITIPETVEVIGQNAFNYCSALTSITIPKNVEVLSKNTFRYCTSLSEITIPENAKVIEGYAFESCTALKTVYVNSKENTYCNYYAFSGCKNLEQVVFTSSARAISVDILNSANANSNQEVKAVIEGPQHFEITAEYVWNPQYAIDWYFSEYSSFMTAGKQYYIDESRAVYLVEGGVAYYLYCPMSSYIAPTTIPTEAGDGTTYPVYSAVCPTATRKTEDLTWFIYETKKDTKLVVVGEGAIPDDTAPWASYNESVTSIDVADSITSIGKNVFKDFYNVKTFEVPRDCTNIESSAFYGCSALTKYTVAEGNTAFSENDNIIYNADFTKLILCPPGKVSVRLIPKTVKTIGKNAFAESTKLKTVKLPQSAQTIEDGAFYNCDAITSISFPGESVTIGKQAFYDCGALQEISFKTTPKKIDEGAFENCTAVTELNMAAGYTDLGLGAFRNCAPLPLGGEISGLHYRDELGAMYWICDGYAYFYACPEDTKDYKILTQTPKIGEIGPYYVDTKVSDFLAHGMAGSVYWYIVQDNERQTLVITGKGKMPDYSYASVMPWDSFADTITDVTVENGVESIGVYAFYQHTNMTSVSIADSVKSIGKVAFSRCSKLERIIIPSSVEIIGEGAFRYCNGMTSVIVSEGVKLIEANAFSDCDNLVSVTLPDSLEVVSKGLFSSSDNLRDVKLGKNVTEIGNAAFYVCDLSSGIELPETVTRIGYDAFAATNLPSVVIPKNTKTIDSYAFENCDSLERVEFAGGVEIIENNAFDGCASLKDIELPEGLKVIGAEAFQDCEKLESITIPSTVETLDWAVFRTCDGLKRVVFMSNMTLENSNIFSDCTNLSSVLLPVGYTFVDDYTVFEGTQVAYLNGPIYCDENGVQYKIINQKAYVVYRTETVQLEQIPDEIPRDYGDGTYPVVKNAAIAGEGYCGNDATWKLIQEYERYTLIISGEGETYDYPQPYWGNVAPWAEICGSVDELIIEEGITYIGKYMFYNNSKLTDLIFPSTLKKIGQYAFQGCNGLTHLTIPGTIEEIGECAFWYCENLRSVTIEEGVTTIGRYAYSYCYALNEVTIPKGVNVIGELAFNECMLTELHLPQGYMNIQSRAFEDTKYELLQGNVYTDDNEVSYYVLDGIAYIAYRPDTVSMDLIPDTIPNETGDGKYVVCKDFQLKCVGTANSLNWIIVENGDTQRLIVGGNGNMGYYNGSGGPWKYSYGTTMDEVIIGDGVAGINQYAFYNCPGPRKITIGESVASLGSYALGACNNLNTVVLKAADLSDVNNNAFNSTRNITSLVIEPGVDVLHSSLINAITRYSTKLKVTFVGPNHFTISSDFAQDTLQKLGEQASFLEPGGSYYVDEYGAIYQVSSESVTLLYVPGGLTEYMIPEAIPESDEGDGWLVVTGIASNALKKADSLKKLTIDSPEMIRNVGDYALANCTTLEEVNGKKTVREVLSLFVEDAFVGNHILVNTKLLTEQEELLASMTATTEKLELVQSGYTLKYYWQDSNQNKPAGNATYYTGQETTFTIELENSLNENPGTIRIYFRFGSDLGEFPLADGWHEYEEEQTKYRYKVYTERTADTRLYFMDIPAIDVGSTITRGWKFSYPSPNSEGGTLSVWAEVLNPADTGEEAKIPNQYLLAQWVTEADTYTLKKELTSTPKIFGNGEEDGRISVRDLVYDIVLTDNGTRNADDGEGEDPLKMVKYSDVMTLPEGLNWISDVLDAIRSGAWTSRAYTENNKSGYECVILAGDTEEVLFRVQGPNIQEMGIWLNENDQVCVDWSYQNNDVEQIISELTFSLKVAGGVIEGYMAKDFAQEDVFSLTNHVSAEVGCYYSDGEMYVDSCSHEVKTGVAMMELEKRYVRNNAYFGEEYPYTVTMRNYGTQHLESVDQVSDILLRELYITPENMFDMFSDEANGEYLTITIREATIYTPLTVDRSVTGTDGGTYVLDIQNTSGRNTEYSGDEQFDIVENLVYQDSAKLVFRKAQNGVSVSLNDGEAVVAQSAEDLQNRLLALGYFVTPAAQYTVQWNYPDGSPLWSGESREYLILSTVKDAFMQIAKDHPTSPIVDNRGNPVASKAMEPNSVSVSYRVDRTDDLELAKTATAKTNGTTLKRDFTVKHDFYKDGKHLTESNVVQGGGVVDIRLTVTHEGNKAYDIVPLVDYMEGAQILMVRVSDNPHLAQYGLKPQTVGGIDYYLLDKPNVYPNVVIGGYLADRVEVTNLTEESEDLGGSDANYLGTKIVWYLTGIEGKVTRAINMKVMLATIGVPTEQTVMAVDNEVWLNDHQAHRLWQAFGMHWSFTTFDKHIVTEHVPGTALYDVVDEDDYCVIQKGNTVTYRLELSCLISAASVQAGRTITVPGTLLFDKLPKVINQNSGWVITDLEYVYDPERVEIKEDAKDKWSLTWTNPKTNETSTDQQYIVWSDHFQITYKDTTDVYIYVTLTYPSGADWVEYCKQYGPTMLENALYFSGDYESVRHSLSVTAAGTLTKGVNSTGILLDNTYYPGKDVNNRSHYSNRDGMQRVVEYYVALYNDGNTRLYLDKFQDVLPEGFTYREGTAKVSSADATIITQDGSAAYYKRALVSEVKSVDGVLYFTVIGPEAREDRTNSENLAYDPVYERFYLLPGEAVVFSYQCLVDIPGDPELANLERMNVIAMPFFDYNTCGLEPGNSKATGKEMNNTDKHDGFSSVINNIQATQNYGFVNPFEGDTQWLESHIGVRCGDIVPEISKRVAAINSTSQAYATMAGYEDLVTWAVTSYNQKGTAPIRDYVLTDVMEQDYIFVSDVKYKVCYDGYSNRAVLEATLFSMDDLVKDEATGVYSGTFQNDIFGTVHATYEPCTETTPSVLSIRFPDEKAAIPEGGTSELLVTTWNGGVRRNTTYTNISYITPSQVWDVSQVKVGEQVEFNGMPSVRSSAQITVSEFFVTTSLKHVTQKKEPSNTANSNSEVNAILIPAGDELFTYTLQVNNTSKDTKVMDKFVILDTLPHVGDHNILLERDKRESTFQVDLADDPNFVIKVGNRTLTADEYTIAFSDATDFTQNKEHLHGNEQAGWYSTPTANPRSFRVILTGSIAEDGTITGTPVPANTVVTVSFDARIHGDDLANGKVLPGDAAWNSFAYYYELQNENSTNKIGLTAAPLKVGVKVPSAPVLVKYLQSPDGAEWTADKEEIFDYVIVKQNSDVALPELDGMTAAEIGEALQSAGLEFTRVSLTVPEGASQSESRMLKDQKHWIFADGKWTEGTQDWNWQNGEQYVFYELPCDETRDYVFGSFFKIRENGYQYKHNSMDVFTINSYNLRKAWDISLLKVSDDSKNSKLAGAWFGLYSVKEPAEEVVIPDGLTQEIAKTIDYADVEGAVQTFYLTDVRMSDHTGIILWKNLTEQQYLVQELQAPDGYNYDDKIHFVQQPVNVEDYTVDLTVVNRSGYEMPKSGGIGTHWNTMAGILLMVASAVVLLATKRRRKGANT